MGAKQTKLNSSASISTSLGTAYAGGHDKVKRRKSTNQTVINGYVNSSSTTATTHASGLPKATSTHAGLNWRQEPNRLAAGPSSNGSTPLSSSTKSTASRNSGSLQRGHDAASFGQAVPANVRSMQRGGQEASRPYSTLPRPLTVQTTTTTTKPTAAAPASPLIPILNKSPVPLIRSMTPGGRVVGKPIVSDDRPAADPSPRMERARPLAAATAAIAGATGRPQVSPQSTTTTMLAAAPPDTDSNHTSNSNSSSGGTKKPSKMAKRFGLSPRFKRKIVETIANKVGGGGGGNHDHQQQQQHLYGSTHHLSQPTKPNSKLNHSHSLANLNKSNPNLYAGNSNSLKSGAFFSQSRLLQVFHSQWNLFSSIRYSSKPNLNRGGGGLAHDDDDADIADEWTLLRRSKRGRNRDRYLMANGAKRNNDSTATFLSTSLQRNSFRYISRRKYKTQSLANPFRHADTNYPVYIHEALFLPEFSVKGQVTEADFEILDVISRGAFGHVIKVRKKAANSAGGQGEEEEEQIYAMKIMWKSQVIRDRALQQVKDEVTIAMNCVDNPLIVKTWYYWQSKRFLYIITDFIENGELLSLWLKVHHFPERLVTLYAVEMSLVLDYLHRRGIIYRDIKMENILLDQRGHVQLIDFGLSKWLPMGERTGTICGTIQYMAPEILSVEPYDHAVDWWSLGILVYALLSGEYPLNAAKDHIQMNEKVSKHVFELDNRHGEHSPEACDLVRKLLRKSPHRRLKSLNEIRRDPLFLKEVDNFVNAYLIEEKKMLLKQRRQQLGQPLDGLDKEAELLVKVSDDERRMLSENFWNPYVIMQNYSPLQMLYDEIYALKQRQKLEQEQEEMRLREQQRTLQQKKSRRSSKKPETPAHLAESESLSTPPSPSPPPPPPPPPPPVPGFPVAFADNCISSTSTTATTSTMSSSNKSTMDDDDDDEEAGDDGDESRLGESSNDDEILDSSNSAAGEGERVPNKSSQSSEELNAAENAAFNDDDDDEDEAASDSDAYEREASFANF